MSETKEPRPGRYVLVGIMGDTGKALCFDTATGELALIDVPQPPQRRVEVPRIVPAGGGQA